MPRDAHAPVRTLPRAASLGGSLTAPVVLTGIVLLSFTMRLAAALAHATPRYFPDEYIYAALARSLSNGQLTVRGQSASFPALLEPILAAPAWLVADTAVAYRLTLGLHAAAWSLAAVPVYLIARRLRLPDWQALACAALTVSMPSAVYSSYVTADALALPFALGAVAVGVAALERPSAHTQVAFLALASLAAFARIQYAVLPLAFVAAAVVVSRGRPGEAFRSFAVTFAALAAAAVAALAMGPASVLGYYDSVLGLSVDPIGIARWTATDGLLLTYAAGWALVPGALVGIGYGLTRPRHRAELGYAALATAVVTALLLEAAVYATNGSARFQERYLIAALPLLGPLFFLGWERLARRGARIAAAAISGAIAALALAVPLSGFSAGLGRQDSPLLQAVAYLEEQVGVGAASLSVLTIVLAASVLVAIAACCSWGPAPVVLVTLALLAGASALATGYDLHRSAAARDAFLGDRRDWVDRSGLEDVAVLVTPGSLRAAVSQQLFWNDDSLTRLLQMAGTEEVDSFGFDNARVDPAGRIVANGRVVAAPLLVQEYASHAVVANAVLVERTANTSLWRPTGTPRLALLATGRYWDGWLAATSSVTLWPGQGRSVVGRMRIPLALPDGAPPQTLVVRAPGVERRLALRPGSSTVLDVPVRSTKRWAVTLTAEAPFWGSGGRLLAAIAGIPRFEQDTFAP